MGARNARQAEGGEETAAPADGATTSSPVAYRAYRLARSGRITAGEWLQALDDDDARRRAEGLCDAATPKVEIWQGRRFVATLECGPGLAETDGRPGPV